jgi:hypothetical protein
MFGFDGPTALLLLLAGLAAVAVLSMRRLGRFGTGDDVEPDEADDDADEWRRGRVRPRLADPVSLLVGGLVILGALAASLVILGLWP